ncbi:MAG: heme lyase CcmF/NrfE family subunit [Caulobacteraceae bacterium]|nr:heme lyase CcmF/NrfE family subunit [Caulobacteraceae bacterium]
MTAELGAFALALALALSLAQAGLSAAARLTRGPVLARAGEGAAVAAFAAVLIAFLALMNGFLTSDFSIANVAANSHTEKPLLYKLAATWGSHEGSLLLWCLWLTGFGAAAALFGKALPQGLKAVALSTQGVLGVLFLAFAVFASNPFARLGEAPIEGRSLNPLLQDPALAFHPPILYGGYVGFSLVFSFAIAALVEGRIDAAWARWVRPWTLAAWSLLTVGITLGAFWAYYELGWGGWWFWDPVENASFMPWLAGAALLHSAIVTEKRGALGGWTVFLALLAFSFSMLGAFLVRSGVLTSVHAFAVDPKRGVMLLAILGVAAGVGFALFAWRAPRLQPGGVFAPVSREGALVLNNLFLAVAAATVLVGTLYPLMLEAATGQTISVGPPYFGLTFIPLMSAAMLILPAGPLLAWKRGDLKGALQRLTVAAGIAILAAVAVLALNDWKKAFSALGVGLGVWLVCGAVAEVAERVRLFRAPTAESWRRLKGLPRGAWGTTLGHIGLGLFALGACVETGWKVEASEVLAVGDRLAVGEYRLTLERSGVAQGPNYLAERGVLTAEKGGRTVCTVAPERRFFPAGRQTTTEVGLCFRGLSDLYVVFGERRQTPSGQPGWVVRAYWNPWARLIFLGPLLMAIGGLVSLSDRRLRLAAAPRPSGSTPPAEARA